MKTATKKLWRPAGPFDQNAVMLIHLRYAAAAPLVIVAFVLDLVSKLLYWFAERVEGP